MAAIVCLLLAICTVDAARPVVSEDRPLDQQVRAALAKAATYLQSISTHGGYVGIYSHDLQQRYGEGLYEKAGASEIWVQPPGTPSIGKALLRTHRVTGDQQYLAIARDAGLALAWGQRTVGGWDHRVNVSAFAPHIPPQKADGHCTLDDRITQGALSFLLDLDDLLDEDWLTQTVDLGLRYMLESQYPNGGWPQWYPLRGGYHDHYTFNDNTINDCIAVLLEAHGRYDRPELLAAARRGGDFIILSQGQPPQAGWAQQYGQDLKPAWARKYEPPAICSAVTARNIRTLTDLYRYTDDERYLDPIPDAIAWLDSSEIASKLWARFYEIGSNRPIYGDRDGLIHYDYDELSEERKKGYAWRANFAGGIKELYRRAIADGTDGMAQAASSGPSPAQIGRIEDILERQDVRGRWSSDRIYIRDFVHNINALCAYLEHVLPD